MLSINDIKKFIITVLNTFIKFIKILHSNIDNNDATLPQLDFSDVKDDIVSSDTIFENK